MVRRGWCERVATSTYRIAGAPFTAYQEVLGLVWGRGPGAMASHRAAARLWGLPGYARARPELLVPHGSEQRSGAARVHVSRVLPAAHRAEVRGVPVTTAARTLFDLAGVDHLDRVEEALDQALVRKLCSLRQVNQVLFVLGRRGRAGTTGIRQLLADRGEGEVVPASVLERRFRRLVRASGEVPVPRFEVDLGAEDWIGRVDCVWQEQRLVVELDGRRWHDGRRALERDRARDNRLVGGGWRVLRFTWDDLKHRPADVMTTIRRALNAHQ